MYDKIKELIKQHKNIFITGSGGTGKSYTVGKIRKDFDCALTSSTGVSALNIGGVTIHSWSGAGTFIKDPLAVYFDLANHPEKLRAIQDTRRLIIDEISMLDAHGLEYIDQVLKLAIYGQNYVINTPEEQLEPFGGIQVIFVGDFFQLPPVGINTINEVLANRLNLRKKGVKEEDLPRIDYCFKSKVWEKLNLVPILLTEVKRQSDKTFIETLQRIRVGDETLSDVALILSRTVRPTQISNDITKLYFKNKDVDSENERQLDLINAPTHQFEARDSVNMGEGVGFLPVGMTKMKVKLQKRYDDFKKNCRIPTLLKVKVGARVMLLSNYKFKLGLCNGSCGYVTQIEDRFITVRFDNGVETNIERDTFEVSDGVRKWFSRKQFPLRLAYAITVHKSQGMTLDSAYIDFGEGAFADGQAYVALSRVKSLDGLFVNNFGGGSLKASNDVYDFYEELEKNPLTIMA